MLTVFPFLARPFSQNDNSPSPQPFTFFILPETSTFSEPTIPILVAVILPSELSQNYQLSDFFVISEGLLVPTFPLLEEPFFDSETNSFVWLFAGLFDASESNRAPAQYPFLLSAYAFFEPVIPSLPILSSFAQVSFSVSPSSYAVEPVELCPGPEICIEYFGIECTCPLPGDETTPPDGGTTPPDSGTNPPDEDDEPPPSPCRGISYATPFPRLSGYIVEPVGEEVIVIAGDTLNLRANGSPDPDLDQTISRAPDPESGECSSSEKIIPGPSLSFIWRLWEDTDKDGKPDKLIGNIGYGKQISWRVPEGAGIYFVELVVDDDGDPDKDNPPEEVKCAKCTAYSTADDPAVRDWLKVNIIPIPKVQLSIHPNEPSTLSADDGECFIVMGVWVFNTETGEWEEADDGSQVQWTLFSQPEGSGSLSTYTSSTQAGFAVTKLITNRQAQTSHRIQGKLTRLVYRGIVYSIPNLTATTETITVVPGLAANFSFGNWGGTGSEPQSLPADERSFTLFTLQVRDRWGNLVADGTPISFLLEGTGALHQQTPADRENFDGDPEGVLFGGSVTKTLRAGMFAENMIIHAIADGRVFSFFNPNNPIQVTIELPYQQMTLPKAGDAPLMIPVIAKVQQVVGIDENGQPILQPVPDGTPVGWWVERGRIIQNEMVTRNGIANATIVLGQISSSLEGTPTLTFFNEKPDEQMLIKVSVPGNFAGTAAIQVLPSLGLFAYLTQPVLVGDESANLFRFPYGLGTPDGIDFVDSIDDLVNNDVLGDDFDVIRYFTHSILKIQGKPNGKVKVMITQGGEYVQIAGYRLPSGGWVLFSEDVQQIPELLLDGQGQGEVLIISKGKLPSNPDFYVTPPWFEIEITDLSSSPAGDEPPAYILSLGMSTTNKVKVEGRVVPKRLFTSLCAFVKGFLVGEEESAAGIAGDVIASFLVWGDLRDFFKELVKGILPGQKADWVVFGFATLGLATTLYPPADPFVAIAKVVVKVCRRLGAVGKRLAEILVRQGTSAVQRALNGDLSMMNALKEFLEKVVGRPPIQDQIERIKRLASLVKSHKSFACGDWLKIGKDITADQLQRLQKTVAELVGAKVIDRSLEGLLTECLSKLGKEVKEEIADLADDVRKDLMVGMARAIKSGVDTSLMAEVLNAPLIKTYGRTTFLQKLTYYAADAENLTDVFRGILHPDHGKSFLFEFHAGTWEAEKRQTKVTYFRTELKGRSASAEIDAILEDGTHIQASAGNLLNPQKWKTHYGERIAVSKEKGATRIKFLFRKGAQVHGDILTYLQQTAPKRHGISIEVEFIDFPVPYP